MTASRFDSPSVSLVLNGLLKRARKALATALVIALAAHLTAARLRLSVAEHKAAKPLTTQFVKRAPRLTKPLELKKRPRPKRRQIRRQMVAVKARAHRQAGALSVHTSRVLGGLARPALGLVRQVSFDAQQAHPKALAATIEGAREAEDRIDMSLEMVDVNALDTGQFHAMVVQDPYDKRNIRGFFHLAIAYPKSMRDREHHQFEDRIMSGILRLARTMNEWTPIRTDVTQRLGFDSAELFKTPWMHLAIVFDLEPTEEEIRRLGQYLVRGGFLFGEGSHRFKMSGERPGPALGYVCLMSLIERALRTQGLERYRDWSHDRLANNHPLFHCYYDFDGGAPAGAILVPTWMAGSVLSHPDGKEPVVRGVYLKNRLALITTNQMYGVCWGDWGRITIGGRDYYQYLDPTRVLQFGINTVIFALTQEGSTTHRLMETLR